MGINFIKSWLSSWYGDFSREELKKFGFLAVIFAAIIGITWCLKPLKDGVFCATVGVNFQPEAKWLSLGVIFLLVMLYSKLSDRFSRDKMFYILCTIYGLVTLGFYWGLQHPEIGLANTNICAGRLIGWSWYVFVESFASLLVVAFWSFVADTTTPESAKRGYSILVMGGQIGGIIGPLIATFAKTLGSAQIVFGIAMAIFSVMLLVKLLMIYVSKDQLVGYRVKATAKQPPAPGFLEGLKLLLSQPYLMGIFLVLTIFGIVTTIIDFELQLLVNDAAKVYGAAKIADTMAYYMGWFGVATNSLTLVSLILGIGNVTRYFGLTVALICMPILVLFAVLAIYFGHWLGGEWPLQIAFVMLVIISSVNYSLGQPTKEQLYIPTSKETKYKAKVWIEAFGHRSSKALGSGVNILVHWAPGIILLLNTGISVLLTVLWMGVAVYLGRKHKLAVSRDEIVC
jgi:AAA family ATP:ADP antiporter